MVFVILLFSPFLNKRLKSEGGRISRKEGERKRERGERKRKKEGGKELDT